MIFIVIFIIFIFSLLIAYLFFLIISGRKNAKDVDAFMSLVREIIGGVVSRPFLSLYANVILKGRYKNREIECNYVETSPWRILDWQWLDQQIYFSIKPLKFPKQKLFVSSYPQVSNKILFKKGLLIYKPLSSLEYAIFPRREFIINILDELVKAAEVLESNAPS